MRNLYNSHSPNVLAAAESEKGAALNAQELVQLSIVNSPVYTRPHPF